MQALQVKRRNRNKRKSSYFEWLTCPDCGGRMEKTGYQSSDAKVSFQCPNCSRTKSVKVEL